MKIYIVNSDGNHEQLGDDMERDVADKLVCALEDAGISSQNIYAELSADESGSFGGNFAQANTHLLGNAVKRR